MKRSPSWFEIKRKFLSACTSIFTLAGIGLVLAAAIIGVPIGIAEVMFCVGVAFIGGLFSGIAMWALYVNPQLTKNSDDLARRDEV